MESRIGSDNSPPKQRKRDKGHGTAADAAYFDKLTKIAQTTKTACKVELKQLAMLFKADESVLGAVPISNWFGDSEHFFHTIFWYSYEATFAFQPWSSAMEFRRYLTRFFHLTEGITLTEHSR